MSGFTDYRGSHHVFSGRWGSRHTFRVTGEVVRDSRVGIRRLNRRRDISGRSAAAAPFVAEAGPFVAAAAPFAAAAAGPFVAAAAPSLD